jgi:hypothetical protein
MVRWRKQKPQNFTNKVQLALHLTKCLLITLPHFKSSSLPFSMTWQKSSLQRITQPHSKCDTRANCNGSVSSHYFHKNVKHHLWSVLKLPADKTSHLTPSVSIKPFSLTKFWSDLFTVPPKNSTACNLRHTEPLSDGGVSIPTAQGGGVFRHFCKTVESKY